MYVCTCKHLRHAVANAILYINILRKREKTHQASKPMYIRNRIEYHRTIVENGQEQSKQNELDALNINTILIIIIYISYVYECAIGQAIVCI